MGNPPNDRHDGIPQTHHMAALYPPLIPRNGHTLEVALPGRVSGPRKGKQDLRSLADQESMLRRWLEAHFSGPCNVTVVPSKVLWCAP